MSIELAEADIVDRVELEKAILQLRGDGIMHIQFHKGAFLELEDAKEIVRRVGVMGNGSTFCNLVETLPYSSISSAAMKYSASPEANIYTKSDAILINSLPQRILGNFYLKVSKPLVPTKLFTSKENAVSWLYQQNII